MKRHCSDCLLLARTAKNPGVNQCIFKKEFNLEVVLFMAFHWWLKGMNFNLNFEMLKHAWLPFLLNVMSIGYRIW